MKLDPYAKGVELSEVLYTFSQNSDSNESGDLGQDLKVSVESAGAGYFLTLESKRWAIDFDDLDRFVKMLKGMDLGKGKS
jgi:hypothetical protein